ncbi:MAG: STAS domain-containing protein [Phycisphaerae bacterium]
MSRGETDDGVDLTIETRRQDDAVVVSLRGEVTVFSSPALRERLEKETGEAPGRVVLDLSEVRYVDSSGVATFVEALRQIRRGGGEMVLACVSDRVRGVIEIARLDTLFPMAETVEEALQS